MTISFAKAERRKAKLRLALTGPAGTGKTMSALRVARGLVGQSGRIALVDTERGSGELYANLTEYDVAPFGPPYTTEKYMEAIHAAEEAGYDCIILDSISHAWNGEGGLLEQHDMLANRPGNNSYNAWGDITPKHQKFVDAMLTAKIHVIATMRSKTEYALNQNDKGRLAPEKIGLAPVQRDGMDYEFTLVLDLDRNHLAEASKDRTNLFAGQIFQPTEQTGETLRAWLDDGAQSLTPPLATRATPTLTTTEPRTPPVPQQPAAKTKRPQNIYGAGEVENVRKRYVENGWSTTIFETSRYDDVWDKDAINEDFQKRRSATQQAVVPNPVKKDPVISCDICSAPLSKEEQAASLKSGMDMMLCTACLKVETAAKQLHEEQDAKPSKQTKPEPTKPAVSMCSNCKSNPSMTPTECREYSDRVAGRFAFDIALCRVCAEVKLNEYEAKHPATPPTGATDVCEECGVAISKSQRDASMLFLDKALCKKCMKTRGA